jgi:hypothetical protein
MSQTKAQLIDNLVQPITGALGSASAPTFSFTADPNTGVYSPGADQLAFSTGGTGRLFIDASGRVGIGTTGPSYTLDVNGSIRLDGSSLANGLSSSGNLNINTGTGTGSATQLIFNIDDTERARIDSSGRLLVGNSTARVGEPQGGSVVGYTLSSTFEGTSTVPGSVSAIQNSAFAAYDGPYFYFARTRGTLVGSSTIVASGDNLGTIAFAGADGTDIRTKAAEIYAQVDGTPGANDMPGRLVFSTTANGASSPTERLRIDSSGRVGIGTANPGTVGAASYRNLVISSATNTGITINSSTSAACGVVFSDTNGGVQGAVAYEHSNDSLQFAANGSERLRITSDGTLRLYNSPGIDFSQIQTNAAGMTSETLDSYEEGTFTPVIEGTTTTGTGTYTSQVGRYTKIGNRVQYNLLVLWTAHTGTGNLRVAGLPFTSQSTGNNLHPAALYSSNLTTPANHYPAATVANNTTTIFVYSIATGGSTLALLAMDTAATLYISGHYETAT